MAGKRSKPKWVKRWSPLCPFDDYGLQIVAGSSQFNFYCKCCQRTWPVTKEDEAKIKEDIPCDVPYKNNPKDKFTEGIRCHRPTGHVGWHEGRTKSNAGLFEWDPSSRTR